ncbi:carbohydrate sulfotransferase 9-like [Penaeus chinensis]|uniref:carbohydrate sulfotransferase 9-like n=1 Tax=Penaeus chinensis TaxID=139456 RepID=UPI001FB78D0B|nr:carbohydrate sulfotransferase 9-like [Penaeus chinensis]
MLGEAYALRQQMQDEDAIYMMPGIPWQTITTLCGAALVSVLLVCIHLALTETEYQFMHTQPRIRKTTETTVFKSGSWMKPDLRHVFQKRREHLLERCRSLRINDAPHTTLWHSFLTVESPGPLEVCVPPKAGSTSWRKLSRQLAEQKQSSLRPTNAILVRHPLSRLASVYRDKYLDGAPISNYNRDWRERTGTTAPWMFYWLTYWLPALVSSGRLAPPKRFLEGLKEGAPSDKSFNLGIKRLRDAVTSAFGGVQDKLTKRCSNSSFTFHEFLEFVVWANDLGIRDVHWAPYTEQCLPCQKDYHYILHLETIQEECRMLLKDVGYPKELNFTTQHQTKGCTNTLPRDDFQYYKDVPGSLMKAVLEIYKHDFELFGYSKYVPSVLNNGNTVL